MKHRNVLFAGILLLPCARATDMVVSPGEPLAKIRDATKTGDRIILRGGTCRLDDPLVIG